MRSRSFFFFYFFYFFCFFCFFFFFFLFGWCRSSFAARYGHAACMPSRDACGTVQPTRHKTLRELARPPLSECAVPRGPRAHRLCAVVAGAHRRGGSYDRDLDRESDISTNTNTNASARADGSSENFAR